VVQYINKNVQTTYHNPVYYSVFTGLVASYKDVYFMIHMCVLIKPVTG